LLTPLQLSASSQSPAAARQTAVLFASAGQLVEVPVHTSVRSQTPADARHTVPPGTNTSAGQSLLTPSQLSATSQSPAAARQTAVLFASAGQAAELPVQVSAGSQAPADGLHTVSADLNESAGQTVLVPSQPSAMSQTPAEARHTVPAGAAVWTQPRESVQLSVVHALPSSQVAGHVTSTMTVESFDFVVLVPPLSFTVAVALFVTSVVPTGNVAASWHWNVKVFEAPAATPVTSNVSVVTGGPSVVQSDPLFGIPSSQERNAHCDGSGSLIVLPLCAGKSPDFVKMSSNSTVSPASPVVSVSKSF
jgi:hypothetical protein